MKLYSLSYNNNNRARAFVIDDASQTITIRTFDPVMPASIDPSLVPATSEQVSIILNNPGIPFLLGQIDKSHYYPATMFSDFTGDPSTLFVQAGDGCWKFDQAVLGANMISDVASWNFQEDLSGRILLTNRAVRDTPTGLQVAPSNYISGTLMTVLQPYADSKLEDCLFILYHNKGKGFAFNLMDQTTETTTTKFNFFPEIKVSGPATVSPSGYATVNVNIVLPGTDTVDTRANVKLYLESMAGYLPKTRINVTAGQGSFKVSAMGLDATDQVEVGIGWKNWPNVTEYVAGVSGS